MDKEKNQCPHCGAKLWGSVIRCYKCHKKIDGDNGTDENNSEPILGQVKCAKCKRQVTIITSKHEINLASLSSLKKVFKDKALICSGCGKYICGKCIVKKGVPGIPLSKAFFPSCPLCRADLRIAG
jgi:hypothetical protein